MEFPFELDTLLATKVHTAVSLDRARPILDKFLFRYMGLIPIKTADCPRTDGKTIYLKPEIDEFKDSLDDLSQNKNVSMYISDLLHEVLHLIEGSFLVDGKPYLEQFKNQGLAHRIWNISEDSRIEHNAKRYLKKNDREVLESSNRHIGRTMPFPTSIEAQVMAAYSSIVIAKGKPSDFQPALKPQENALYATPVDHPELHAQGINTLGDLIEKMVSINSRVYGESVKASWSVVPEVYDLLQKALPQMEENFNSPNYTTMQGVPKEGQGEGEEGQGAGQGGDQQGQGQGQGQGQEGNEEGDQQGQGQGAGQGKGQTLVYTGFRGDAHDFDAAESKGKTIEELTKGYHKPEEANNGNKPGENNKTSDKSGVGSSERGKVKNTVLIKGYDSITQKYTLLETASFMPYPKHNPSFRAEMQKYAPLRDLLVEHFEMMKPNKMQRKRFTESPDELNMEAVIEVLAAPALREDARVYDSYHINERDCVWAILQDISGSTNHRLPSGQSVIDVENVAHALLHDALTEIGDVVLSYAFSTGRSNGTIVYELDGVDNIGALSPEGGNADGIAIRAVLTKLLQYEAKEMRFIVISDGKPVEYGSMVSSAEKDPAVVDTSMAFQEGSSQGVDMVYFNVDSNAPKYFHELTKGTTYACSLNKPERLPDEVFEYLMEFG